MSGDTSSDPTIGERIKRFRRRKGLSQPQLAQLVGRSESWLSQVERGLRTVDRLSTILELAKVLGVEVVDLTGRPVSVEPNDILRYDALDKLRKALTQYDVIPAMLDPYGQRRAERPPDLARIRRAVVEANRLYQASKYLAVGELLPSVIVEAHRAVRELTGPDRRQAHGALAEVYHITSKTLSRVGEPGLAFSIAERSLFEAQVSEDPLLVAASSYHLGNAFLRAGEFDRSNTVVLTAAEALQHNHRDLTPVRLAASGGLTLIALINAARTNDHAAVKRWLSRVAALAEQVEDGRNDLWLAFGATNVTIHGVAVAVELGDPVEAIRRGEAIDVDDIPSELRGRRSQVLIDLARAYADRRMDSAAVNTLLDAEHVAPEALRFNSVVRSLIQELLRREHRASTPQLRCFAYRLEVLD